MSAPEVKHYPAANARPRSVFAPGPCGRFIGSSGAKQPPVLARAAIARRAPGKGVAEKEPVRADLDDGKALARCGDKHAHLGIEQRPVLRLAGVGDAHIRLPAEGLLHIAAADDGVKVGPIVNGAVNVRSQML